MPADTSIIIPALAKDREAMIAEWVDHQLASISRPGIISGQDLAGQCTRFIDLPIASP